MSIPPLDSSTPSVSPTRAWWQGFASGFLGLELDFYDLEPATVSRLAAPRQFQVLNLGTDHGAVAADDDEHFPWHDPQLPIVTRMEMAEEKPLDRRLMAAMGQLDCGSCGYVCKTYAEAIARGEEDSLSLCAPGGNETKRMLKQLIRDNGPIAPTRSESTGQPDSWSRKNPFPAKLVTARPLNLAGSKKATTHVEIDLTGSDIFYEVGDALGVYATNHPDVADLLIRLLNADRSAMIDVDSFQGSFRDVLLKQTCLKSPTDELIEFARSRNPTAKSKAVLKKLLETGVPDGVDVIDIVSLADFRGVAESEFMALLEPLQPRLYSIASSMKHVGNQVHLTVGRVNYQRAGRQRYGVASTMFADRLGCGDEVRVFPVKNHHGFTVPANPSAPMIMVGPGTGIAPFMAFMQERFATGANGKNWLFFGDQHEATDFLYRDTLEEYVDCQFLNHLSTAFSRDGDRKIYVQDRMREQGFEIWEWIKQGGHFYVCGDASRMAVDVDRALKDIISERGGMSADEAENFVVRMSEEKRYVCDVY